jgi:tetratricopeptide (TPR) repeat protein
MFLGLLLPGSLVSGSDGHDYRLGLIPVELAESYFPSGDRYLIPVDRSTETLIERAQAHESRGEAEQAYRVYSSAHRRAGGTPSEPYIRFKLCALETNPDTAIECLGETVEQFPNFPLVDAVRFELAFRLYIRREYTEALETLEAIQMNELDGIGIFTPSALLFSGIILSEQEEYERALFFFEESLTAMLQSGDPGYEPIFPALYLEIAKVHLQLDHFDRSERLLIRILGTSTSPIRQSESLWYLGRLYTETGDLNRAYSAFTRLSLDYPLSPLALQADREIVGAGEFEIVALSGVYDENILNGLYVYDAEVPDGTGGDVETGSGELSHGGRGYAVQIGSFARRMNAESEVKRLEGLGYAAYFVQAQVDGQDYFRVRIGPYSSREEASTALEELKTKGLPGFIVRDE